MQSSTLKDQQRAPRGTLPETHAVHLWRATWNSKVNRQQVKDGCSIMMTLMPVIIEAMLSAKKEDWGEIFYPVVK